MYSSPSHAPTPPFSTVPRVVAHSDLRGELVRFRSEDPVEQYAGARVREERPNLVCVMALLPAQEQTAFAPPNANEFER